MSDLISRKYLLNMCDSEEKTIGGDWDYNALRTAIELAPAVDAAPVEYPIILVREGNGAYSALIPDFGCATCGKTEAEARLKAAECMAGRMSLMRNDNETFPEPSKMTNSLLHDACVDVAANPDNAFWIVCSVKAEKDMAERAAAGPGSLRRSRWRRRSGRNEHA